MRALLTLLLLGGCFGGSSHVRPAVMPKLSELPGDPIKRDAVLDSANTVAGPEHRKGMTVKERKAETFAATAAAFIGSLLSDSETVTLGSATMFEEAPAPRRPAAPAGDASAAKPTTVPDDDPSSADLVPWIKLK